MMQNNFAIIVPYRDRALHLSKFLPYMKQRFKADIFVIEQENGKPFNRGKLLNIGFLEAKGYKYYALHDVDMLPVQSDYSFPEVPTLLATKAEQFGYKMPCPDYFGGVVLINHADIVKCNGYHNEFWGWGGEDDSFRNRIIAAGLQPSSRQCIYNSLSHNRKIDATLHAKNVKLLESGAHLDNGLTNCEYKILSREGNHIKVSI